MLKTISYLRSLIRHLLSLIRFSHTIFALPFALLAALMAWRLRAIEWQESGAAIALVDGSTTEPFQVDFMQIGPFQWTWDPMWARPFSVGWLELLGIVLGMVSARSAAMAFNRLADRKIDAQNPRTSNRHLPAGILSVGQVALFAMACSLSFVASTLLFLPNRLPLYLSVPVLSFLCGYSYTKRFTSLAHVWLGVALGLAPIAVWIALRGEQVLAVPADLLPAMVLGAAVMAWVAGFDMIYACQDCEFDRAAKLRSLPARLGVAGALRLAAGCHLVTVALLAILPLFYPPFGTLYGGTVVVVAVLLTYEHALVRPDDLDRVNTAFFHVNAVISLGLFAVAALDLWLGSG